MKTSFLFRNLIVFLCVSLLLSCSGEDGETGPQGEPGLDGNANVIASEWIPTGWPNSATVNQSASVTDAIFTDAEILSNAALLVFIRAENNLLGENNVIYPVPYSEVFGNFQLSYRVNGDSGQLIILAESIDSTNRNWSFFTDFRYVIVPSAVDLNALDINNYQNLSSQLGLED